MSFGRLYRVKRLGFRPDTTLMFEANTPMSRISSAIVEDSLPVGEDGYLTQDEKLGFRMHLATQGYIVFTWEDSDGTLVSDVYPIDQFEFIRVLGLANDFRYEYQDGTTTNAGSKRHISTWRKPKSGPKQLSEEVHNLRSKKDERSIARTLREGRRKSSSPKKD